CPSLAGKSSAAVEWWDGASFPDAIRASGQRWAGGFLAWRLGPPAPFLLAASPALHFSLITDIDEPCSPNLSLAVRIEGTIGAGRRLRSRVVARPRHQDDNGV